MSYILDALRRAERERDTGKPPSVESLNRGRVEVDRARVPLSVWSLAIATAVVACTALAILLWPHAQPKAPATESVPTAPPVPPTAARAPAPAEPTYAETPIPTAIEDHDDVVSLDDVTGEEADDSAASAVDESATAPMSAAQPEDTASDSPAITTSPAAPASAPDTSHGTVMVPAGVTALREMPARYREQFPVHTLDVHVYDPDPARRWVMIDGKRYREGATLTSGPQIAQIIEAGVVFDYRGARVLLPVR